MSIETHQQSGSFEEAVWVEDPSYRANGALVIPSDDADVEPVPPGTPLGEIERTALAYGPMHEYLTTVSRDPGVLRAAVDALLQGWDPDVMNTRIKNRVKDRESQARRKVLASGRARWL